MNPDDGILTPDTPAAMAARLALMKDLLGRACPDGPFGPSTPIQPPEVMEPRVIVPAQINRASELATLQSEMAELEQVLTLEKALALPPSEDLKAAFVVLEARFVKLLAHA